MPQASLAVNVRTCVRLHPDVLTPPSTEVIVGVEQLSVAVADPSAASMAPDVGLHPKEVPVPDAVMPGLVLSVISYV